MADDVLYGRTARLTIATPVATPGDYRNSTSDVLEINGSDDAEDPGNRVQFKITKTDSRDPNTAELTITNLSPTTRALLQRKGAKVLFEAGYLATGRSGLFRGDVRTVDHARDGADWTTVIKCGDGERSWRYARLSESFAAGTGAGDVLKRLANATGLQLGNIPTEVASITTTFDQGYAVSGPVSRSLARLVASLGYTWSIQDETLQILLPGSALAIAIPEIGPDSGLVGSPEMGSPEDTGGPALCKFKALLTPTRPGAKVRLRSRRYSGEVLVKRCTFEGDTSGGPWHTTFEGQILR